MPPGYDNYDCENSKNDRENTLEKAFGGLNIILLIFLTTILTAIFRFASRRNDSNFDTASTAFRRFNDGHVVRRFNDGLIERLRDEHYSPTPDD